MHIIHRTRTFCFSNKSKPFGCRCPCRLYRPHPTPSEPRNEDSLFSEATLLAHQGLGGTTPQSKKFMDPAASCFFKHTRRVFWGCFFSREEGLLVKKQEMIHIIYNHKQFCRKAYFFSTSMIFFGVELVQNRLSLVRESNASDFSQIELIRNKNSEVVIYLKIVQCSTTMYVFLAYVHNVPLECTTLFEGVPTFNFFLL